MAKGRKRRQKGNVKARARHSNMILIKCDPCARNEKEKEVPSLIVCTTQREVERGEREVIPIYD